MESIPKFLVDKRLSNQVITSIDQVTDKILDQLQDPETPGSWDRRGLVMGHVQSGKTSNYIGLINKAADAGYKVIIVVAGTTNILRKQTQFRIDEGFSGRDSAAGSSPVAKKPVGVGQYGQDRPPVLYTNTKRDFNTQTAGLAHSLESFKHPSVFVIKKNASTLRSLTDWLRAYTAKGQHSFIDLPMLLIDDEADNASINTKASRNEISRINQQLRDLLRLFTKSCYVGYSATPFANIFIDPSSEDAMVGDDLFPRNFIVSLDPPTNYFGPDEVFGDTSDRYLRPIDDHEQYIPIPHKKDLQVHDLPPSLETAIRAYIVGRAIRILRGQEHRHSAMMVNASVFTDVQTRLTTVIHHFLTEQRDAIRVYASMPPNQAVKYTAISELQAVFETQFPEVSETWEQVQHALFSAVGPIDVVQVNSRSNGTLDYDEYGDLVATLSPWEAIRFLVASRWKDCRSTWFLRNSMAYDTLMQMGRWFGYRDGYDDLCRIWMPDYAADWYTHITESIEILRGELKRMEQANATPTEFGLRVRAHPDTLIITARNKMGTSTKIPFQIGLAGTLVETVTLENNQFINRANLDAARKLTDRIRNRGLRLAKSLRVPISLMATGAWVPWNVIADFAMQFQAHPAWVYSDATLIRDYLRNNADTMPHWDVSFSSLRKPYEAEKQDDTLGININIQRRSRNRDGQHDDRLVMSKKSKIASRGAERAALSDEEVREAERQFTADQKPGSKGKSLTSISVW